MLGAVEYRGKPSPVLEARLNHALFLYLKGMAPRIITTGGAGGDPVFTEGSVGRSYLAGHGVPPEAIVVEREGESTAQSVAAVAEIMRRMNLKSAIVVSDGYHIFRVKKMLESSGLKVYGSPRPSVPPGGWRERWQYLSHRLGTFCGEWASRFDFARWPMAPQKPRFPTTSTRTAPIVRMHNQEVIDRAVSLCDHRVGRCALV